MWQDRYFVCPRTIFFNKIKIRTIFLSRTQNLGGNNCGAYNIPMPVNYLIVTVHFFTFFFSFLLQIFPFTTIYVSTNSFESLLVLGSKILKCSGEQLSLKHSKRRLNCVYVCLIWIHISLTFGLVFAWFWNIEVNFA